MWRRDFDDLLARGGVQPAPGGLAERRPGWRAVCYDCGAICATAAAWRRHRWKWRGARHDA
eukprot:3033548-Lingulodinium_polyedra.AAC.1